MKTYILAFFISCFLFYSCKNNDSQSHSITGDSTSIGEQIADTSSDIELFLLPTPLQVGAVLKLSKVAYNDKLPIKPKDDFGILTSSKTALLLGAITIDAGYSAIFDQKQSALKYGKNISKLLSNLNINAPENNNLLERFERNQNRSDSLAQIIMESYSAAHQYFRENNKEEMGLQIIAGSFIEGLYLCAHQPDIMAHNEIKNLISQQKQYADNIFNLLSYYSSNNESAEILNNITKLKEALDKFEVVYDNDSFTTKITQSNLDEIKSISSEIRNSVFKIS